MFYDKKIKYLDYIENGERIRGGGFVKLEICEASLTVDVAVRGVWSAKEMAKDVYLCGKGREELLGKISIREGQGTFRHTCHIQPGMKCMGMAGDELTGIRIPLGDGQEIACMWDKVSVPEKPTVRQSWRSSEEPTRARESWRSGEQAADVQAAGSGERIMIRKPVGSSERVADVQARGKEERRVSEEEATIWGSSGSSEGAADVQAAGSWERKASGETVMIRKSSESSERAADVQARGTKRAPATVVLQEDKWLQLFAIYPHIKPFQDEREYLSIGPADFVLFPAESYRAVNNSFMLHGYYNYRHLILTRAERGGETRYYVGAPGNYYDRERQVAIMFGFESFECAQEPAQSSDFGYYMMRVLL